MPPVRLNDRLPKMRRTSRRKPEMTLPAALLNGALLRRFVLSTLVAATLAFAPFVPARAMVPVAERETINVAVRRITETQYRHTIADVFGPDIKIEARFEPEKREAGLLAIGSALLSLTSSGFEQYFALATSISDQVLSEKQRTALVSCQPANPTEADDACARWFIEA